MPLRYTESRATQPNTALQWLLRIVALLLSTPGGAAPPMLAGNSHSVSIEWRVPAEEMDTARDELHLIPAQISPDTNSINETRGLPLLYIVTGAVMLPQLAKAILDVYKDWKYGPVIITQDLTGKLSIIHDAKAPGGTVTFVDAQGHVQLTEDGRTLDQNRLLDLLVRLISKR